MVRLGIIGAGIMGERLASAAIGHAADTVRVTGLWDPAAEAVARVRSGLPQIPAMPDAAAVIAASDCVYVASPPGSHLDHGETVLAAGRALFCEKPLATDTEAAARFVANHADARAAVNFPFASSTAVARLRSWLPEIGTADHLAIAVAFATWPRAWQRDAAGWLDRPPQGGFTREVVSHFLFLTRRLLGPLTLISARASFPEPSASERDIEARLTAGGIPVSLTGTVGAITQDDHNLWTLTGAAGAIRLRDWSYAEQLRDGAWQPDPESQPNARMRPLVLRRQLEAVAAMTAGQAHPLASLAEAFEVQQIVEAILTATNAAR